MIPGKRQDFNSEESNKSHTYILCTVQRMDHYISIHYTSVNQDKITETHLDHHFMKQKALHFYSGVFCYIDTCFN